MTIYESIGLGWVVFTSSLATIAILYFAFIGMRRTFEDAKRNQESTELERIVR